MRVKVVENLHHVIFECVEYSCARECRVVKGLLERGGAEVFLILRSRWKWRELKTIRQFFMDAAAIRDTALGKQRNRASRLQQIAEMHWF